MALKKMKVPTQKLIITGHVQGVFFRATAKDVADGLGITGWVKNMDDGRVAATVTGTAEQLEYFAKWCHEGPPRSKVDHVEVSNLPDEQFDNFKVIR